MQPGDGALAFSSSSPSLATATLFVQAAMSPRSATHLASSPRVLANSCLPLGAAACPAQLRGSRKCVPQLSPVSHRLLHQLTTQVTPYLPSPAFCEPQRAHWSWVVGPGGAHEELFPTKPPISGRRSTVTTAPTWLPPFRPPLPAPAPPLLCLFLLFFFLSFSSSPSSSFFYSSPPKSDKRPAVGGLGCGVLCPSLLSWRS